MKQIVLTAFAVVLMVLVLAGMPEIALYAAAGCALAEVFSLFAAEMYFVSAAVELSDARHKGLWHMALLLGVFGAAVAAGALWLLGLGVIAAVPAAYMAVRLAVEFVRVRPAGKASPGLAAGLLRALPEALLLRGMYLLPAAALLVAAWYGWGVNTVWAYAAGLAVFSALRVDNSPAPGAEAERFPVRWIIGAAVTAVLSALGWNGVFSAAYCAWGVIAALLPVRHGGKAWLCALLVTLQALCGVIGVTVGMVLPGAAAAAVLGLCVIALQRKAIYAAYLPVRAWMIRRRAR